MKAARTDDIDAVNAPTVRHEKVGQTIVVVHGPCATNEQEWSDYCRVVEASPIRGVVVFAPPGCPGPNADQRRQVSDAFKRSPNTPRASIVTTSAVHRYLITALNWLSGGAMRGFAPSEIDAALAFANVDNREQADVVATARRLAEELRVGDVFRAALH